jgi:hypothetical protein
MKLTGLMLMKDRHQARLRLFATSEEQESVPTHVIDRMGEKT